MRRRVEWSAAILIRGRQDHALLVQEACYIEVPKLRCRDQGSLLTVIPAVSVCATINQWLCDVGVPFMGRKVRGSLAIFFWRIHTGAAVYQETYEVKVFLP